MRKQKYVISYLRCQECGEIMPIPRLISAQRENNHIKTMWCWKCKKERDFIENKNYE